MEQRVSLVTLGVANVAAACAFYEALGWHRTGGDEDVAFFQAGGMVFALWGRDQLAADSVMDDGGWGGVALAHNVRSPPRWTRSSPKRKPRVRASRARAPRPSGASTRACSWIPTAIRGDRLEPGWPLADDGSVHLLVPD
jgi:catechol 2,3-dioxygenase-like lactoylglutathione lyase family enzyme